MALAVVASCFQGFSVTKPRPVNIVVVFIDDMGYGDLGCCGATGYKTPNLDRMASQGVRFTNFVSAQAVCSASRAGIMTGCYPNRVGISGALMPDSKIGLNPDEETIPEILKMQHYKSIAIGKWHLGCQKEFLPLQQGFDEYFGLPYSNDMWPVNYDGTPITRESKGRKFGYPQLPLIEGNEKIREIRTLEDQSELTTLYTDANPRESFLYYYRRNNLEGVRKGNWKLVFAHPGRTYHGFQPGKDGFPGGANENFNFEKGLYDLRRDPGEQYDVKEFYPEVVEELKKIATDAREDLGDDLTGNQGKNRRAAGKVQ
jgi:arylsulfatase A-like enzyme